MSGPQTGASDKALAEFVEVKSLIEKARRVRESLAETERAVLEELEARYAAFTTPRFEDKTLLEVMLRNVTVRAQTRGKIRAQTRDKVRAGTHKE